MLSRLTQSMDCARKSKYIPRYTKVLVIFFSYYTDEKEPSLIEGVVGRLKNSEPPLLIHADASIILLYIILH
jgi:hypothetical protein